MQVKNTFFFCVTRTSEPLPQSYSQLLTLGFPSKIISFLLSIIVSNMDKPPFFHSFVFNEGRAAILSFVLMLHSKLINYNSLPNGILYSFPFPSIAIILNACRIFSIFKKTGAFFLHRIFSTLLHHFSSKPIAFHE